MVGSSVFGCSQRSDRNKASGVTFHKFPSNPKTYTLCINVLRRENWTPTVYSKVCSNHFEESCFNRLSRTRLWPNAVPTIFESYPKHLQKNLKVRPYRSIVKDEDKTSSEQAPEEIENVETSSSLNLSGATIEKELEVTSLKRKLSHVTELYQKSQKKLKVAKQKNRRLIKKKAKFEEIIQNLSEKKFTTDDNLEVLRCIPGPNKEFLQRQLCHELETPIPAQYSVELKTFALTLHFYSPRAYRYVRKVFNTCLPHERTLKRSYQSVDGEAGFTLESFKVLRLISEAGKATGIEYVWSMAIDEMAIRKGIEWNGVEYRGYVNFGTGLDTDDLPIAKGALVFMLICINSNFKIPISYFLINSINSEQQLNLLNQSLTLCHESGVKVVNVTFDGISTNLSMATKLGCNFDPNFLKTSFPHPSTNEPVCITLDACHMIKLVRNTLGDKKHMVDEEGGNIQWKFINELHSLQEETGLHLGNKLRKAHLQWHSQKMKVKLAVQLLSNSVADAIEHCEKLKLTGFVNTKPTVKFIRMMNQLFDILNSRNMRQKFWKQPINKTNISDVTSFLQGADKYIWGLKDFRGNAVVSSNRKMGFLGLQICIKSALELYSNLVPLTLTFLPTYKLSQDHLELFFSSIRTLGGCNNNPTVCQFISAYKKMLVHCELNEESRGNCLKLEDITILNSVFISKNNKCSTNVINSTVSKRLILIESREFENSTSDDSEKLLKWSINGFNKFSFLLESISTYIAGFVVRSMEKKLKCEECIHVLRDNNGLAAHSLIEVKNRGGLIYPSMDVIKICKESENVFRQTLKTNTVMNKSMCLIVLQMSTSVLKRFLHKEIFPNLKNHMLEQNAYENHLVHLIRAIAQNYLNIRLKHWTKQFSANLFQKKNRHLFTKQILFSGE